MQPVKPVRPPHARFSTSRAVQQWRGRQRSSKACIKHGQLKENEVLPQKHPQACPCVSRVPRKGDTVRGLSGRKGVAESDDGVRGAWKLEPDEVAIVIELDADYDFKLKNASGLVSAWTYRKFYEYVPLDLQASPKSLHASACGIGARAHADNTPVDADTASLLSSCPTGDEY